MPLSSKVTKGTPKKKKSRQPTKRKPYATADWPSRFLEALRAWPNVTQAARLAGVSRTEVYRHRDENTEFARQWAAARKLGIEAVEDAGFDGARSNPTLMIFMLKNLKPDQYADRAQIENFNLDVSQLTDEQLEGLATGGDIRSILAIASASRTREAAQNDAPGTSD